MNEARKHRRKFRHLHLPAQPFSAKLCQHGIFALILLVLVTTPLWGGGRHYWALGVAQAATWLGGALWLARIIIRREVEWAAPTVVIPVLVVLGYGLLRHFFAPAPGVSSRETLLVASGALFFLTLHCNLSHRWQPTALLWTWVALALGLAAYGIAQVVVGEKLGWDVPHPSGGRIPATGPFAAASHFAGYLAMILTLAVANAFFSRRTYQQKVALLIGCGVMGLAVMFSLAHEAWWGLVAGVLVVGIYVIRRRESRFRWALIGALVLAGVLIAVVIGWQGVHRTAYLTGGPPPYLPLWRSALEMSLSHLGFGNGPGMFTWLFAEHRTLPGQPEYARNELLNVLADYGLVGVLLVVWVAFGFVWTTIRIIAERTVRYSQEAQSNRYAFAIGGLAAFAAMGMQSLADYPARVPANLFALMAIMAVTLSCGVRSASKLALPIDPFNDAPFSQLRWPAKVVLVAALIISLAFLGIHLQETVPAAYYLHRAESEKARLNWSVAENRYLRAWQFDPHSDTIAAAYGDLFAARATWNARQRDVQTQHALRWYGEARKLNPYAHDLLVKTARLHDATGHHEQALDFYKRAIQADPDNAAYHVQLALHHLRQQEDAPAIAAFQRARDLGDPTGQAEAQLRRLGPPPTS